MTKTQELELLRETAAKLAEGKAYSADLLAMLIPLIEADIRSDVIPEFDLRAAQDACRALRIQTRDEIERARKEFSDRAVNAEARIRRLTSLGEKLARNLQTAADEIHREI